MASDQEESISHLSDDSEADSKNVKKRASDDTEALSMKKKKKDDTVPSAYSSADWSSSSSDNGCELTWDPLRVIASNFPDGVSDADVMSFFEGTPSHVQVNRFLRKGVFVNNHALVTFDSESKAEKARNASGRLYDKRIAIHVGPQGNDFDIIFVGGFSKEASLKKMKKLLKSSFKSCGKIKNIFLPADPNTSTKSLGFGYILFQSFDGVSAPSIPSTIEGFHIRVRVATLKKLFTAEIEGEVNINNLVDDEKTKLKKTLLPFKFGDPIMGRTEIRFSWRAKRPDIIPKTLKQTKHDCWTIPLRHSYVAVMTLNGKEEKEIQAFLAEDLEKAVDQASVASRLGITKLKHVVPIMARFGCQMLIHHRPRSSNMSDHEEFEKMILDLLGNDNGYPLMVTVEAFQSLLDFDGEGIYVPLEMEMYQRTFENLPYHCLFLTGDGIYNGLDHWQLQQSWGAEYGDDQGFIRMCRHMCLIKHVVELRI